MSNTLVTLIDKQRDVFNSVSCDTSISFDRESKFAIQILQSNDYLGKIAMQNQNSLVAAITNLSAIGLSLNPASKLAYLVPRKGAVCLDVSYLGMMHIAQQCGAIQWGQAIIVRENDSFELQPIGQAPFHKYNPFSKDRGEIIGCYVVVKTDTNDFLTDAIPISKIYSVRDRSEAWKAYVKDKSKLCPWVTDAEEMILKTNVKHASKMWPRRERLDNAIHYLNTDGGEGIHLAGVPEPKDVTPANADQQIDITDKLREMGRTWEQLQVALRQLLKRDIEAMTDLTSEEAVKVLAFMQRKAA